MPINKKGIVLVCIDGLSEQVLSQALVKGHCRFIGSLIQKKKYRKLKYFCGLPAATTATIAELFYGDNTNIPGFNWYDRLTQTYIRSSTSGIVEIEKRYSLVKKPLLADGSCILASFSGGATLSNYSAKELRTYSPKGLWVKLRLFVLPVVKPLSFLAGLIVLFKTLFVNLILFLTHRSWHKFITKIQQVLSKIFLGDFAVFLAKLELLRETPALFIDIPIYDVLAHEYGPESDLAISSLNLVDKYCWSIYRTLARRKRKYEFIILSDHGQTKAISYKDVCKKSLKELLRFSIDNGSTEIIEIQPKKTSRFFVQSSQKLIFTIPSGSIVNVYFSNFLDKPLFLSQLNKKYPKLIARLLHQEVIGWILVRRSKTSQVLLGKYGSIFIRNKKVIKIIDKPFLEEAYYQKPFLDSLARYAGFDNLGDLVLFGNIVNGRLVDFEHSSGGTHGGLFGEMLWPFVLSKNTKIIKQLAKKNDLKNLAAVIRTLRDYY